MNTKTKHPDDLDYVRGLGAVWTTPCNIDSVDNNNRDMGSHRVNDI